jgi:hypothetical protein
MASINTTNLDPMNTATSTSAQDYMTQSAANQDQLAQLDQYMQSMMPNEIDSMMEGMAAQTGYLQLKQDSQEFNLLMSSLKVGVDMIKTVQ